MHTTLAYLMAAGQVATAFGQFSYQPRATTTQDDNLATITTLVDGHLPTCFTGHPTHPCPTGGSENKRDLTQDVNSAARIVPIDPISMSQSAGEHNLPTQAPAIAVRQAPTKVSNGDYIPEPNEWAIPQNFTFTDTISSNTTSTASSTVILTTLTEESTAPTATEASEKDWTSGSHGFADRYNVHAIIESAIAKDLTPAAAQPTGAPVAHLPGSAGSELAQSSNATTVVPATAISSVADHTTALPTLSHAQSNATNSSSSAHLSGMIGTLISQAMFPGKMRAPSTASPVVLEASVSSSTQTPSVTASPSEAIVAIPMSQAPNTTATDASLQAFVHPINTEAMAESQHTASSNTTLPTFASATPLPKEAEKNDWEPKSEAGPPASATVEHPAESTEAPTGQWSEKKFDKELDTYLNSVVPQNAPAAQASTSTEPTAASSSAQPATSSQTFEPAHKHPAARRFIS